MGNSLLVGVPVYGNHELTHAIVDDLQREDADFVIIDNRGDYEPIRGERVERPGTNLGWAGGSNLGFRIAFSEGYENAMTLNNDTRLSVGYFDGLLDSSLPDDRGLVAGVYDDKAAHGQMLAEYDGPAQEYTPVSKYRDVNFVDGTGLLITRDAWRSVGDLDERTFGPFAWGADLDLSLRVRDAGYGIYVTEKSFLNHFGRATAYQLAGKFRYVVGSHRHMVRGIRRAGLHKRLKQDASIPHTVHYLT
ncbi:hypothetical protein [Gordonia soli]|uniref:Putative glycosyltransferase n=1 Tax=Gordonia soli NBRC 108243 TaxID=1223545 RepID=M0QGP7_9ACTN|nr:hypothetical protein [Gordonia soli]GAC67738.1 putative glycosyltransferase [Gordonia soli NBRC 108243]